MTKYGKKDKNMRLPAENSDEEEAENSSSEEETEVDETGSGESDGELPTKTRKSSKRAIADESGSESDTNAPESTTPVLKKKPKAKADEAASSSKVVAKKRKPETKTENANTKKRVKKEEKNVTPTSSTDSGLGHSPPQTVQGETKHPDLMDVDGEKEDKKKGGKKEVRKFNDRNVDYNLFENDPCNVVQKRCKLSPNLLIGCKMVEMADPKSGLSYESALICFERKSRNDSVFDFNMALSLAPAIIKALQLMIKDNPKFFSKYPTLD